MNFMYSVIIKLLTTFILSLIITPFIRMFAFKIGATDKPDARRVNKTIMPTIGGLGIFIVFAVSSILFFPNLIPMSYILPIILGGAVIIITGMLDDIKELSPKMKLLGIIIAALIIYYVAKIRIDSFSIPFFGKIELGWLSLPVTIIWIVAITNAVNLIDGLDGLASGVSMIALSTIGVIGYFYLQNKDIYISIIMFILVASIAGFLPYNFHPASIFLGDTGALFLGFMISVLSLQGLKNATLISLITPLMILGVPITDTVFAIIRRYVNKQPISSADKMHLHHRLLSLGFSHRGAVLTIYCLALIFSFIALLYNYTTIGGTIFLTIAVLLGLELFVELIGLVGPNHQPLIYLLKMIGDKNFRESQRKTHDKK